MTGSIPIALLPLKGQIALRWIESAGADYTLPFLSDTIGGQIRQGRIQNLTLEDELAKRPRLPSPTAFIFHMSRCGSTLTSRMLAAVPRFHVISEPAPINHALSLNGISERRRAVIVNGLINAFSPEDRSAKQAYFVKLTSWNAFYISLFRQIYPQTPWIFIYREPYEVLASHDKAPANWLKPRQLFNLCNRLGLPIDSAASPIEQASSVLACICEQALKYFNPAESLFLNYNCLKSDGCKTIGEFLRLDLSESDLSAMRAVASYHSKNTHQQWVDARATTSNSNAAGMGAAKSLLPIYRQLDKCKTLGAY